MAKSTQDQTSFDMQTVATAQGPVECLGMKFESDEKRREYFLEQLRQKLKDPEFRKIEGFPIGSDEDILALSDPPYYTACPNPFIAEFIQHYGKPYDPSKPYSREPFAADVSEGKNDPIYSAHSYHTKVPHKAIMRYILQYTEPGGIVLDGFCGTGMTGIASQLCGNREEIESLGYRVDSDGAISQSEMGEDGKSAWKPFSRLGARLAVLNDLSPAATFIAYNYNVPVDVNAFAHEGQKVLNEVDNECGWMYETVTADGTSKARMNYTVWSEVFSCPECSAEIVFSEHAYDEDTQTMKDDFPCPSCGVELTKSRLTLLYETHFDPGIQNTVRTPKRIPVLINYSVGKSKHEKKPCASDFDLLKVIDILPLSPEIPTVLIPEMQMMRVGRMQPSEITHLHQFFLARPRKTLATLWLHAKQHKDARLRLMLLYYVEQAIWGMSVLARYVPTHYSQVNQYLSGVFYLASHIVDVSPRYILDGKLKRLVQAFGRLGTILEQVITTTQDISKLGVPDDSVDYIFTDPPFGENIYYSDLNFIVESWHGVTTSTSSEAIVDRVRGKALLDYQHLMSKCFANYFRVLKPGHWMTVEFHNSKNSVWNSIQEALQNAGFVVADVRTLDKKQGSYQQMVSGGAVKQDLVISAYKPNGGLEDRFRLEAGTVEGIWDFVRTHLKQLPVFVSKDGQAEVIAERQNYLLFDRMVAFHVQRGVAVPLSATEFYAGLVQRFSERDGMYFLPEQVAEYDKRRMTVREVLQLQLFVIDEATAIQWLKQQILTKPQTFQDIHPQFLKELGGWQKHEKPLELSELLGTC
jgi:predicted RNA methylase